MDGVLPNSDDQISAWSEAARIVFAMSPNSALCERVFALLKNMFGDEQMSSLADYIQAALMLNELQRMHATTRSVGRVRPEGRRAGCGDGCRCRCVRAVRGREELSFRKFLESCGPTGQKFKMKFALESNESLIKANAYAKRDAGRNRLCHGPSYSRACASASSKRAWSSMRRRGSNPGEGRKEGRALGQHSLARARTTLHHSAP